MSKKPRSTIGVKSTRVDNFLPFFTKGAISISATEKAVSIVTLGKLVLAKCKNIAEVKKILSEYKVFCEN